jgi:hypothetical protein
LLKVFFVTVIVAEDVFFIQTVDFVILLLKVFPEIIKTQVQVEPHSSQ